MPDRPTNVIEIRGLVNRFGPHVLHDGLDLDVRRGEVLGVVGGSGTGKSVLMRTIVGLNQEAAGDIRVLGQPTRELDQESWRQLQTRWGVLFQNGALFSSLTVSENVQAPMRERGDLSPELMEDLAGLKIKLVGLPLEAGAKYPSQLSGGMKKRAGLGRA